MKYIFLVQSEVLNNNVKIYKYDLYF